jgi:integrase
LTRAFSLIWLSFQGIPQQLRQPGDIGGYAPDLVTNSAGTLLIPGIEAKLPFKAHPHMLRNACGYALANRGTNAPTRTLQAYLGHRSIQSTVPLC